MKITYEQFKSDINDGFEYHFHYKNRSFAVSRKLSHFDCGAAFGTWFFAEFGNESFLQTFCSSTEFLEKAKIDAKLLSDIWGDISIND